MEMCFAGVDRIIGLRQLRISERNGSQQATGLLVSNLPIEATQRARESRVLGLAGKTQTGVRADTQVAGQLGGKGVEFLSDPPFDVPPEKSHQTGSGQGKRNENTRQSEEKKAKPDGVSHAQGPETV